MKKLLYLLLIVPAILIIFSCSKEEQELTSINPGLYEINFDLKYGGQLVIIKQRARYNADGTFESTDFQNNQATGELKGKYKVENGQLISYDTQYRPIVENGKWMKKTDISKVDIRKMRKGSYQYYFKYPDEQTREKYKGMGLSEGWKTYNRISD